MNYIVLKQQTQRLNNYSVAPIREKDILSIKEWRNAQRDVLRQKRKLTDDDQKNYFSKSVYPLFGSSNPSQILFSYLLDETCIGYGGLTNIDWESKRVELSYLVDHNRINDAALYEKEFGIFISLMKKIVFDDLNFNRIFTETYDIRPLHISTLEKNGFKLEGIMKEHIAIKDKFENSFIHGFTRRYYHA